MTLDDIKLLLPELDAWAIEHQILDTLTAGNEVLQEDAGAAAARYVYAALIRCQATGRVFSDDELEILADAVHKRAIYELYTRSEIEASANDKREDAKVLLRALLGDCVAAATTTDQGTHVGAAVSLSRPRSRPSGSTLLRPWDPLAED